MSQIPGSPKQPFAVPPAPSLFPGQSPPSVLPPQASPSTPPPEQRWENEGGHPVVRPEEQRLLDKMRPAPARGVEEREDLLMKVLSPDGLPPTRGLRNAEWRWVLGVFPLLALAGAVLAVIYLDVGTMVGGLALLALLVAAASPVWLSALLRWREHVRAHDIAEETVIVETGHTSPTPAEPQGQVVVRPLGQVAVTVQQVDAVS